MAENDWKKTASTRTLIRYENKETGDLIFAIPTIKDKPSGSWDLHLPSDRIIDYRGQMEVKKALRAYIRSH